MTISRFIYFAIVLILMSAITYNFLQKTEMPPMAVPSPVVVELYSSKYCPSCPAAEKMLATLNKDPNIIAFSCHVTYFDYKSNKDPFARDFCEVRQHGYANQLTDKRIFTPFMVFNGILSTTGESTSSVKSALEDAIPYSPKPITFEKNLHNEIIIKLPEIQTQSSLHLWAFGLQENATAEPDENVTNPAATLDNLGNWDGLPTTRSMQVLNPKISQLIILAQENGYDTILAAGKLDLH